MEATRSTRTVVMVMSKLTSYSIAHQAAAGNSYRLFERTVSLTLDSYSLTAGSLAAKVGVSIFLERVES